jgi:cephalosporin-C deacetylase-like acetyl esterase
MIKDEKIWNILIVYPFLCMIWYIIKVNKMLYPVDAIKYMKQHEKEMQIIEIICIF